MNNIDNFSMQSSIDVAQIAKVAALRILNEESAQARSEVDVLDREADATNIDAMLQLGYIYSIGNNTTIPVDMLKAVMYFQKAAQAGSTQAMTILSQLYSEGSGVDVNLKLAAHYAALASQGGDPEAQLRYANLLIDGTGVQKSIRRAAVLLESAAERGSEDATSRLESVKDKYAMNSDYSLKKSSFKRSGWATILSVLAIIPSLYLIISVVFVGILDGSVNELVMATLCIPLLNFICAIMIISKAKVAFGLLRINLLLGLISTLLFGGFYYFATSAGQLYADCLIIGGCSFLVSLILFAAMFIKNRDGMSFVSGLLDDGRLNVDMLYELGTTLEYTTDSQASRAFISRANIAFYTLAAIVTGFLVYMIFFLRFDVTISGNALDSPFLLFLFFVCIPLALFTNGFTQTTFIIFKDEDGNTKGREKSEDTIDFMMDVIMPIIGRFVLLPMIAALVIYYIIYFLLQLVSTLLPTIFAAIVIGLLFYVLGSLRNIVYKKYRQKLLIVSTAGYAALHLMVFALLFLWGSGYLSSSEPGQWSERSKVEISNTDNTAVDREWETKSYVTLSETAKTNVVDEEPKPIPADMEDLDQFIEGIFFSGDIEKQKQRVIYSTSTIVLMATNEDVPEVRMAATADTWKLIEKIDRSKCSEYQIIKSDDAVYLSYSYGTNKSGGTFTFVPVGKQWFLKEYSTFD